MILNWFRSRAALLSQLEAAKVEIATLKAALDESWESHQGIQQQLGDAKAQVEKMAIMRDPVFVDEAGLRVAREIEDLFARGSPGGRAQRLAQVQVLIVGAIQDAIRGQRDYNLGWRKKHTDAA